MGKVLRQRFCPAGSGLVFIVDVGMQVIWQLNMNATVHVIV
jgi:hypothetical protein